MHVIGPSGGHLPRSRQLITVARGHKITILGLRSCAFYLDCARELSPLFKLAADMTYHTSDSPSHWHRNCVLFSSLRRTLS